MTVNEIVVYFKIVSCLLFILTAFLQKGSSLCSACCGQTLSTTRSICCWLWCTWCSCYLSGRVWSWRQRISSMGFRLHCSAQWRLVINYNSFYLTFMMRFRNSVGIVSTTSALLYLLLEMVEACMFQWSQEVCLW